MTGEGPKIETVSVTPSADCERLAHPSEWRPVVSGTGDRVLCCVVCSGAFVLALERFGDRATADEFVRDLRRDATSPWTENQEVQE